MTSTNQATRRIGDVLVSPIGFGAMGISTAYGPVGSDEERFKVCNQYTDTVKVISSYDTF